MSHQLTKWLGAAFLFYIVGVQLDLLLIGHYESFWQYLPIITLPVTMILVAIHWFLDVDGVKRVLHGLSVVLCILGILGIYFHLGSNFEFEAEMRPSLSNLDLFKESLTGALPVLAPASLIPLGLLNYVLSELKK